MPIYEFYCKPCNTIYSFFSRSVNTKKIPACPVCGNPDLCRQMSMFAVTGKASEGQDDDIPVDAGKMERAMEALAGEAGNISDDDPRQAAQFMRRFGKMAGMGFGPGMEEALRRMEKGEDPEQIEAEMGDVLENEEPFFESGPKTRALGRKKPPARDQTLYDLD
jgi:putative FmdB family regulatory protein